MEEQPTTPEPIIVASPEPKKKLVEWATLKILERNILIVLSGSFSPLIPYQLTPELLMLEGYEHGIEAPTKEEIDRLRPEIQNHSSRMAIILFYHKIGLKAHHHLASFLDRMCKKGLLISGLSVRPMTKQYAISPEIKADIELDVKVALARIRRTMARE